MARFDRHRWCFAMAEDERRLGGDHVGEEVEEVEDMMWEDTHMTSTHDDTGAAEDWSEEEVEVCEGKWCVRESFERGVCVCACRMSFSGVYALYLCRTCMCVSRMSRDDVYSIYLRRACVFISLWSRACTHTKRAMYVACAQCLRVSTHVHTCKYASGGNRLQGKCVH